MKKALSMAFVALLVVSALALAACGGSSSNADLSNSKYVGTWKASAIALADMSENVEEDWILTVNGDGTGTLDDGSEVSNFTWSPADNGFKAKGDVNATFTEDGESIKAKVIGVELVFERQ